MKLAELSRRVRRWLHVERAGGSVPPPPVVPTTPEEAKAAVIAAIGRRRAQHAVLPICELARYRELVGDLPRPSDAQIDAFIDFVSEDHSWYKKLPLLPPGKVFTFFLDPLAGFTRLIQPEAKVSIVERTPDSGHYNCTTEEYRSRFGHLACDRAGGVRMIDLSLGAYGEYGECDVFCVGDNAYRIPDEIREAGEAEVTAVIHPLTARAWVWNRRLHYGETEGRSWPEATGGSATLQRVKEVCARPENQRDRIIDELVELLGAERGRLRGEMKWAIRRVLDLSFGPDRPAAP